MGNRDISIDQEREQRDLIDQGEKITKANVGAEGDEAPEGSTPLEPAEADALMPSHISTRGQLNEWEQRNISLAVGWLAKAHRQDVLSLNFIRELHRRMFDQTWRWAGTFRHTEKSIGIAPELITERLVALLGDVQYWVKHGTYSDTEAGARYHHRLVEIHPFPDGNGRHARLAADALVTLMGGELFTWGSGDLNRDSTVRQRYLAALRAADRGDPRDLIEFVRG